MDRLDAAKSKGSSYLSWINTNEDISNIVKNINVSNKRVIAVAGSGVQSIEFLRLGALKVLGIDCDEEQIRWNLVRRESFRILDYEDFKKVFLEDLASEVLKENNNFFSVWDKYEDMGKKVRNNLNMGLYSYDKEDWMYYGSLFFDNIFGLVKEKLVLSYYKWIKKKKRI